MQTLFIAEQLVDCVGSSARLRLLGEVYFPISCSSWFKILKPPQYPKKEKAEKQESKSSLGTDVRALAEEEWRGEC